MGSTETAHAFLDTLKGERDRLQNAVDHLVQSNAELKEALEEGGPDPDFKAAIEENIVVIAKYCARIERLDKEIAELQRGLQLLHEGEALLTSEGSRSPAEPANLGGRIAQLQEGGDGASAPAGAGGDVEMHDAGGEPPEGEAGQQVQQEPPGQQQQQQQQQQAGEGLWI